MIQNIFNAMDININRSIDEAHLLNISFEEIVKEALNIQKKIKMNPILSNSKVMIRGIPAHFWFSKVIFNDPKTIVIWYDGSKTIVTCGENDTYDREKGLALCFMKRACGDKSGMFNKVLQGLLDG